MVGFKPKFPAHRLGLGGAKHCQRVWREAVTGVTKPDIRRLARRGGVKRTSNLMYEETRGALKIYLERLVGDAIAYRDYRGGGVPDRGRADAWLAMWDPKPTLTAKDVVHALRHSGRNLYGYGI
ncbi:histone H4 [Mycena vitilis]|nr:histone H4 [Mycena vitilis]